MSKYGVISGLYFPVFSPNTGKYGPEITPYLDTFHGVAVEFWPTFDIKISIILPIFYKKLQSYTFQKAQRRLSKLANIHINRATHYKNDALKKQKIRVFWWLVLQNKNC